MIEVMWKNLDIFRSLVNGFGMLNIELSAVVCANTEETNLLKSTCTKRTKTEKYLSNVRYASRKNAFIIIEKLIEFWNWHFSLLYGIGIPDANVKFNWIFSTPFFYLPICAQLKNTSLLPIFVCLFSFMFVPVHTVGPRVYIEWYCILCVIFFIKYIIVACAWLCASSFTRTHKRACNYNNSNSTKQRRQQAIHIFIGNISLVPENGPTKIVY